MHRVRIVALSCLALLAACGDPLGPTTKDVPYAHAAWLEYAPQDYSFEVATTTSWFPSSGYIRVRVADGAVVAATRASGEPVAGFALTLDGVWRDVLAARDRDQVNQARFTFRGVPVLVDLGQWEVDGGVRYDVRDFRRHR